MEGKTVLVAGASGFVGSELALELCKSNRVYGLARFSKPDVRERLERAGVRTIQKDVFREPLGRRPVRFDYVFSELALLYTCDATPDQAHDLNTYFVGRLMGWSRGASGVVLASTGAVYEPGHHMWNEQSPVAPRNLYGLTKYGGEVLGQFLCRQLNVPTSILRYFNPYGIGGGKITDWATRLVRGEAIDIDRSNTAVATPVHISDCVRYTIEGAALCSVPARVINIGSEAPIGQVEAIAVMAEALGKKPKYRDITNGAPFWTGDCALMTKTFGPPRVALRDGLRRIVREVAGM